jgi:predicted exporter
VNRLLLAILVWSVAGLGAWLVASRVNIHTDLIELFPEGSNPAQRLLLTQLKTGPTGRMILMKIEGVDADRLAEISKRLGSAMRDSGLFRYVGNGAEGWTDEQSDQVFRWRYLLSPDIRGESFTPQHLRDALEERLDELRSTLAPMVRKLVPADPTGEFLKIQSAWIPDGGPSKRQGVWFSADGRHALLIAETKASGYDIAAQELAQGRIKELFLDVAGSSSDAKLTLVGPAVFAVEAKRTVQAEVWQLTVAAALLVFAFLYLSYRSFTLFVLGMIPFACAVVVGIVAVDWAFGFVHAITLAFGVTLLGVVDDYPIHLFSHLTGESSAVQVMRDIWPTMRLGIVTTAIGFSALLFARFPGLSQLGLFAITGLFTAAAVTRWLLPFLVPAGFHPPRPWMGLVRGIDHLGRARIAVPIAVVLALVVVAVSNTSIWENDIANLSPIPDEKKALYETLRSELGAPEVGDIIIIEGADQEEVLRRSEDVTRELDGLRDAKIIGGYDIASRYLPSRRTQAARRAALPDERTLQRNLQEALKGLPFKPELFRPFVDAVRGARSQAFVQQEMIRETPLGLKVDSMLFEQRGRWFGVVPLRGISDRGRLADRVTSWGRPYVSYIELKAESNRLLATYRNETLRLLGWGTLAIAGLLTIKLRSIAAACRVLLPIASAVIVAGALIHSLGQRFSLFHLASFLLVIGLGLDYAIFFDRAERDQLDREHTVYGLVVCSMTTILVFAVLAASQITVLRAIGMTTAIGSSICLLFVALLANRRIADI